MKKQRFMGCIDNTGTKLVFYVTNIDKTKDDALPVSIFSADLELELSSDPDLVYEEYHIPEQLAKDEVY